MKLTNHIYTAVILIVVISVLFSAYATLVPTTQDIGDSMNDTNRCEAGGCVYNISISATAPCRDNSSQESSECSYNSVPLSGLFGSGGLIFLVIMAAFLIVVIKGVLSSKK